MFRVSATYVPGSAPVISTVVFPITNRSYLFTSIRFILVLFICSGCSNLPELDGVWFHYNDEKIEHSFWDISNTGEVTIERLDGKQLSYLLTDVNDTLVLISKNESDTISLGSVSLHTPSKVIFTNGSHLLRNREHPSISKSLDEFTSYITNRSLKPEGIQSIERLYFSTSLNPLGFKSVDVLSGQPNHNVDINSNWLIHEFNDHIAISFVQYHIQISTILIHSLSNQEAKGTFIFGSNAIPVDLKFGEPYKSSSKVEEKRTLLSESSWYGEDNIQIVDTSSATIYMEAIESQPYLNFESIESADIEAVFKRDNTLTIRINSSSDSFEKVFKYKISRDAKYLFVFEWHNSVYSAIDSLNVNSSELTLFADLPILYKEKGYITRTVKINLRK